MLRSAKEIIGYGLYANDGEVGKCKDLLFDDRWWTVRHMVADTGGWLAGKQVLVSPILIETPDWGSKQIFLNITQTQLENCPGPDEDETVSREHEEKLFKYFGYPYYWSGDSLWGVAGHPAAVNYIPMPMEAEPAEAEKKENHLRSFKEVKGYAIDAKDGDIGHVEDFILDDETWALRYLVADTRDWLPGGKKVLLSLNWVESVSWVESKLTVNLLKEQIENGPEFDPDQPVNIEYEAKLYDYYGRPFEKNIDRKLQQSIANPFI